MPLLAASALLLIGLWMRWPSVGYDGPATQDAYNSFAFDRFAYSDIASLYFRDGLAEHLRPYLDYPLEYPVGMGFLIYLLNSARSLSEYLLTTSLWMGISALLIVELVPRFPRGRVWLFALSPALALYLNLNWDMWGVLLMVASLLLFARERDGWAAVALAAAVWTKFFPVLFLPFLVAERLRRGGWRPAGRFAAIFALASAAINAPLLVLAPGAWWRFLQFNAERGREMNLWNFFDSWQLSTAQINNLSAVLLVGGLVVLLVLQWRGRLGAWLPACCAVLGWFFFVGKVYSPQYGLWIVTLLAVMGASTVLAVAWSAMDLAYFAASFLTLGLGQYGEAQGWFVVHALLPAAALREALLLVVVGWCIAQMRVPVPES